MGPAALGGPPRLRVQSLSRTRLRIKGRRKHINFFNINFWPLPPKTPHLGPPEKSLCASFPGKQGDPHKLFRGESWGQKGGPKRAILVYCSFPALKNRSLYRVLLLRLFSRGFGHYSPTIARLSPLSGLERGASELLQLCVDARQGEIGPPNRTLYRRGGPTAVEGLKQR